MRTPPRPEASANRDPSECSSLAACAYGDREPAPVRASPIAPCSPDDGTRTRPRTAARPAKEGYNEYSRLQDDWISLLKLSNRSTFMPIGTVSFLTTCSAAAVPANRIKAGGGTRANGTASASLPACDSRTAGSGLRDLPRLGALKTGWRGHRILRNRAIKASAPV